MVGARRAGARRRDDHARDAERGLRRARRRHAETCEAARRWLDNPWVIDGVFVEVDDLDTHHARARRGRREDPARARGAGHRLPDLHGGGSRGPPLDVRPALQRCWLGERMSRGGYVMHLGVVPYPEAWALQRSLAGAVSQGAIPDTILLLEHPPVVTLGRRTDGDAELHIPAGAEVELVETDRGGKSTFHGPGQLVCYPILDLNRHGRDVKRYVRDLEEALIATLAAVGVDGRADRRAHRRLADPAAAQDRLDRRPRHALGDDARLRAQRRPRPGAVHGVDHGLRARGRGVHDDRARARPAGHGRRACGRTRSPRSRRSSASARGAAGRRRRRPLGAAGPRAARGAHDVVRATPRRTASERPLRARRSALEPPARARARSGSRRSPSRSSPRAPPSATSSRTT